MDFLKLLTIGARKGRIATVPALVTAVGEGAAFLSQGAAYAYIRARSGTMGPHLMQDPAFGAAMERCTWEGFAAFAADLTLIIEAELRPHMTAENADAIRAVYRDAVTSQDVPQHRKDRGWDDRITRFDQRLTAHMASPPHGIAEICREGAEILLEHLPVTDEIRRTDREMVLNNVEFRFIEHVDGLRRRMDFPALARALATAEPGTS